MLLFGGRDEFQTGLLPNSYSKLTGADPVSEIVTKVHGLLQ